MIVKTGMFPWTIWDDSCLLSQYLSQLQLQFTTRAEAHIL